MKELALAEAIVNRFKSDLRFADYAMKISSKEGKNRK